MGGINAMSKAEEQLRGTVGGPRKPMAPTIPQGKVLRTLELMQLMCAKPKTVDEISEFLDTHVRSVWRYLRLIDQLGVEVKAVKKRGKKKRYYIDQCPCCGKTPI